MTLTQIKPAGLSKPIDLGDNEKIRLGTSNDLELYHDGSSSFISDVGTGSLKLTTNGTGVDIQKGSSETIARFIADGAVELYHNGSRKLETKSTGIYVTGDVESTTGIFERTNNGTSQLQFAGTATTRLNHLSNAQVKLEFIGYNNVFGGAVDCQTNQGYIRLKNGEDEQAVMCRANGAVELFYDNNKKLETTSVGASITGKLGIGSTSPGYDITVYKASGTSRARLQTNGTSGSDYSDIAVQAGSNYAQMFIYGTGQAYLTASAPGTMSVGNIANSSLYLTTNNTVRLTITNDGKVGINDTNPQSRLAVSDGGSTADPVIMAHVANSNGALLGFGLYSTINSAYTFKVTNNGRVHAKDGIIFGTDTSTNNLLSDYEEGTFTPTASAVTLTGTIAGHYTKIGDLVTVQCIFVVPNTSNTSDIEIDGLPFNGKNGTDGSYIQGGCVIYHNQGGGPYTVLVANNMNRLVVYKADGNRQTFNQFSGKNLRLMATYKVA